MLIKFHLQFMYIQFIFYPLQLTWWHTYATSICFVFSYSWTNDANIDKNILKTMIMSYHVDEKEVEFLINILCNSLILSELISDWIFGKLASGECLRLWGRPTLLCYGWCTTTKVIVHNLLLLKMFTIDMLSDFYQSIFVVFHLFCQI